MNIVFIVLFVMLLYMRKRMLSLPDFKQKQVILAFLSRGERLSFKNDNVIIKDKDGVIKHQSTCYKLFTLFIVGHASITTGLLQRSKKFGFNLILMGHNLRVYGQFNYKTEGNFLLRHKQYKRDDILIARHLVYNKLSEQCESLKSIRKKNEKLTEAIKKIKGYRSDLFQQELKIQSFLGLEGVSARLYFQQMFGEFNWKGRKPRAKRDTTNTLLDIGYTLLFNFVEGLLNQYGFDLYQGVYHQNFYQRKSLVCDLVEPFRTIIDGKIRKAHRLGQINEDDFDIRHDQYLLFGEGSKKYSTLMLEEIMKHKQDIFLYVQNYYRCFMKGKEIDEYPIFSRFKGN